MTQVWNSFNEQNVSEPEELINSDLHRLSDIALAHGFQLNSNKSTSIIFDRK